MSAKHLQHSQVSGISYAYICVRRPSCSSPAGLLWVQGGHCGGSRPPRRPCLHQAAQGVPHISWMHTMLHERAQLYCHGLSYTVMGICLQLLFYRMCLHMQANAIFCVQYSTLCMLLVALFKGLCSVLNRAEVCSAAQLQHFPCQLLAPKGLSLLLQDDYSVSIGSICSLAPVHAERQCVSSS